MERKELHGLYAQRALAIVALAAVIAYHRHPLRRCSFNAVLGQPRQLARRVQTLRPRFITGALRHSLHDRRAARHDRGGPRLANLGTCAAVFGGRRRRGRTLRLPPRAAAMVEAAWASSVTNNQYLLQVPSPSAEVWAASLRDQRGRDRRGISRVPAGCRCRGWLHHY